MINLKPTRAAPLLPLLLVALWGCDSSEMVSFCALPVDGSPVKGPDDAWVTIVEFSDYQCPYCARVGPSLREVEEQYGEEVRVVFKHLPLSFHEHARPAAVAAICAEEQERFWEMSDLLFEHQSALSEDDLASYAEALELDLEQWESCRASGRPAEQLAADESQALRAGVTGTPTLFFNGLPRLGALPTDELLAEVEDALDDALASGADREAYYDMLTGLTCE